MSSAPSSQEKIGQEPPPRLSQRGAAAGLRRGRERRSCGLGRQRPWVSQSPWCGLGEGGWRRGEGCGDLRGEGRGDRRGDAQRPPLPAASCCACCALEESLRKRDGTGSQELRLPDSAVRLQAGRGAEGRVGRSAAGWHALFGGPMWRVAAGRNEAGPLTAMPTERPVLCIRCSASWQRPRHQCSRSERARLRPSTNSCAIWRA